MEFTRRAVAAGLDSVSVAGWFAAGELSVPRRRLARAVLFAVVAAIQARTGLDDSADDTDPRPAAAVGPEAAETTRPRRGPVRTGVVFAAIGVLAAAPRLLRRRWLARLTEAGHPHPHLALGLRLAAISFVLRLAADLAELAEPALDARADQPDQPDQPGEPPAR